jgi:hypothetical protein
MLWLASSTMSNLNTMLTYLECQGVRAQTQEFKLPEEKEKFTWRLKLLA